MINKYSNSITNILITTNRNPSQQNISFSKTLNNLIPYSLRINRGNSGISAIVNLCKKINIKILIIVHGFNNLSSFNLFVVDGLLIIYFPTGPTLYLSIKSYKQNSIYTRKKLQNKNYGKLLFKKFITKKDYKIKNLFKKIFMNLKFNDSNILFFLKNKSVIFFRRYVTTSSLKILEIGPRINFILKKILLNL